LISSDAFVKGMVASMGKNKISEVMTQTEEKTEENMAGRTTGETAGGNTTGRTVGETAGENTAEGLTGEKAGAAEEITQASKGRSAGKAGRKRKKGSWIRWGILVGAALSVVMFCMYGFFRKRAEEYRYSPLENYDNIQWLYRNCYMLYKDLYNAQTDDTKNYKELFLQPKDEYAWILESDAWNEDIDAFQERYESVKDESGNEESFYTLRDEIIYKIDRVFQDLESEFSQLNNIYDYVIRDNNTGFYLTNMSEEDLNKGLDSQFFQVGFTFNEHGGVTVEEDVAGVNTAQVRKYANEAVRSNTLNDFLEMRDTEFFSHYGMLSGPVNCTVIYRISNKDWTATDRVGLRYDRSDYGAVIYRTSDKGAYRDASMGAFLLMLLVTALFFGLFLPVLGERKPWKEVKICSLPLEPLLVIGTVVFAGFGALVFDLAVYTASGGMENLLEGYFPWDFVYFAAMLINIVCLTAFFFCGWYLGVCARAVRELGIKEYIKQKCIFYRIFPFIKSKVSEFYDEVCHFDVTRNAHKIILKIVLFNAVILLVISCFWVTGFPLTVAYSVVLYFILRKYINRLQVKYGQLLHATNEIAEGNLNVKITEDLGVFEPFKPQIIRIQNGFKNAVEEETKSQRMKAELITNVSHDLKTPLTAIITYINLLKDENITEEQRREYLDTLERKSLRLKVLIEDLFEVSKANSQTITLNIMDVDIMNLVKQVSFEMTDKLQASDLDVRMNLTDEKIILPLDSQKTYRIYENLLGNIAKYAMPGTRVYINGFRIDDTVIITMKNISAEEITVDTAELTERFVRGDASRNTEGSGLGLAIVKSFMELQGGELSLEVDGDLFKATTTWHIQAGSRGCSVNGYDAAAKQARH